jgi:hypothetical protein
MLTDEHKEKRIQFVNWIRNDENYFSDEKTFDIDEAYDSQNDLIRMVSRSGADIKGGARQKRNFSASCYGTSQVAYSNI